MKGRVVAAVLAAVLASCALAAVASDPLAGAPPPSRLWESPARLHRFADRVPVRKTIPGTLVIDTQGVEFRSDKFSRRWLFLEIHTFDLSNGNLTLTIYQNRRWHEPGERRFHFTLPDAAPSSVALLLADRIERPVRNGAPDRGAPAIAEIPARHTTRFGGSNGTLRVRAAGIDYVSSDGRDSHSWRWSDIQTIANPDPYSFRITAYREIAEFELKEPLSRELFDQLWSRLYASDLNLSSGKGGGRQ